MEILPLAIRAIARFRRWGGGGRGGYLTSQPDATYGPASDCIVLKKYSLINFPSKIWGRGGGICLPFLTLATALAMRNTLLIKYC